MKFALFVGILLEVGIPANAKEPVYKNWKIFESEVGYQLKYPSCWKIDNDMPGEHGPVDKARNIFIGETTSCLTKRLSENVSRNGISIMGGWGPRQKRSEAIKEIKLIESHAPSKIHAKDYLIFRHLKFGNIDAISWVENWPIGKYIRWQTKVYCSDWWISITGPAIDEPNIDKSMFEKFKKGDLALPEPYNTMINSFRCIPAKQKEDPD